MGFKMKKILLTLMMIVSASFAFTPPATIVNTGGDGLTYYFVRIVSTSNSFQSAGYPSICTDTTNKGWYSFGRDTPSTPYYATGAYDCVWNQSAYGTYYTFFKAEYTATPPTQPDTCDTLAAKYPSPSGQCIDCMAFTNFSGRASCACNAIGSSWTPQNVMSTSYSYGGYTYQKTKTECDNATWVAVYHDPVPNTPTDNNNTTDNNSTTPPSDTNTTVPTDGNTTTPSQSDVVNAVKDSSDKTVKAINETNTAIKSVDTSVQAVNTTLQSSNTKLDSMVSKLSDSNALLTDSKNIQSDTKSLLAQEFKETKAFRENLDARLKNLIDTSLTNGSTLKDISSHTASTTNAVNAQGTAITDKLGEVIQAIKDSNNSTDMTATNDLLDKIKGDTNSTAKGVDTLHDDFNVTNDLLGRINGYFDSNDSYKTPDINESKFELSDLLPDNNWFETNKLKLNFGNYSGGCYCQTAEFRVAGQTFIFPPQEALDVIPFDVISKIFMAFIYVLGLKEFLRN